MQKIIYWILYFPIRLTCKINYSSDAIDLHKKPYIIASSHIAIRDPFLAIVALPWPVFKKMLPIRFISKDAFFNRPWQAFILLKSGCIPAEKGKIPNGAHKALEFLKKHHTIFIFPEGKINYHHEPLIARSGIYFLLENCDATLLLVKLRRRKFGFSITYSKTYVGKESYKNMVKKQNIMETIHDLDPIEHPFKARQEAMAK